MRSGGLWRLHISANWFGHSVRGQDLVHNRDVRGPGAHRDLGGAWLRRGRPGLRLVLAVCPPQHGGLVLAVRLRGGAGMCGRGSRSGRVLRLREHALLGGGHVSPLTSISVHSSCLSNLYWPCVASVFVPRIAGDMAAKRVDVLAMTSVAFLTCAVVTLTLAVVFEPASWSFPLSSVRRNSAVIVASALLEAVGFTVGTMGQEYTPPTRAALLFSLSSVVCAVAGYVCLDEQLTGLEGLGCLLMTAAAALPNICEGADKDKDGGGDGDGDGELGSGPLRSMQIGTRRAESPKSRLLGYDFGSFSDMNSGSNSHSAGSLGSTISIWILGIKKLFVPQQPFYTSPIT